MEQMRTIVALGLLTQPRKERLAARDLVHRLKVLAGAWMYTFRAINTVSRSAVVEDGLYGRWEIGVKDQRD